MKTFYFICPHNKFVTGGVKQIYRQVELLNKNNINAYIVHKKKGQKANWISNQNSNIVYNRNIFKLLKSNRKKSIFDKIKYKLYSKFYDFDISNGILVIPEIYSSYILNVNQEYIIYNQNCYYTFNENFNLDKNPYSTSFNIATIINSKDGYDYLNKSLNIKNLYRITLGIDTNLFSFKQKKERKIAFMPRKLSEDVKQVISILKLRNKISNWEFIEIDNFTENEVADCLKKSAIFLSFSHKEGLGLPPMEAMATGCVVIGYHGQGGKEFFKEDFSFTIDYCDIINFVLKIEELCELYDNNFVMFDEISKLASKFISQNYNISIEEKSTLDIYNNIINNNYK